MTLRQLPRMWLARACRKLALIGLGWGDWWTRQADWLEGAESKKDDEKVRGIGA